MKRFLIRLRRLLRGPKPIKSHLFTDILGRHRSLQRWRSRLSETFVEYEQPHFTGYPVDLWPEPKDCDSLPQ